jgi:hypothetical protein
MVLQPINQNTQPTGNKELKEIDKAGSYMREVKKGGQGILYFDFWGRFDILLEKRLSGVAELRYTMLYGKSRIKGIYHETSQKNYSGNSFGFSFLCFNSFGGV